MSADAENKKRTKEQNDKEQAATGRDEWSQYIDIAEELAGERN